MQTSKRFEVGSGISVLHHKVRREGERGSGREEERRREGGTEGGRREREREDKHTTMMRLRTRL